MQEENAQNANFQDQNSEAVYWQEERERQISAVNRNRNDPVDLEDI